MSNTTKNWYALYTKAGYEKKVANLLSRRNIENFCPQNRLCRRKKVVLEPLFNSYVFVQIENLKLLDLSKLDYVMNFVYWLGQPAVIRDEEIAIIKSFVNEYVNVKLEKTAFLTNNSNITAKDGNMSYGEKMPNIVSVKNNIVKIGLPSLGYTMLAELDAPLAEVLKTTNQSYTIADKYQLAV